MRLQPVFFSCVWFAVAGQSIMVAEPCLATRQRQVIPATASFCKSALEFATRDAYSQSGFQLRIIYYFDRQENSYYYGWRVHADPDPGAYWHDRLGKALREGLEPFMPIAEAVVLADAAVFRCKDAEGIRTVSLRGNDPLRIEVNDTPLTLLHFSLDGPEGNSSLSVYAKMATPPTEALAQRTADRFAEMMRCSINVTIRDDYWFPDSDSFPMLYPFAPLGELPPLEWLRKQPEARASSKQFDPHR